MTMEKKRYCNCSFEGWKHVIAMLSVSVVYGVVNTLIKKSMDEGLSVLVFLTLRQFTATAFLGPIAFFKERESRPKFTRLILFYTFLSALLGGSIAQYLFFLGMQYTTATFACAFLNITPVFTFLVALPFRMEKVNPKNIAGKAKLVATVVCLGGTVVLMLYRGVALTHFTSTPTDEQQDLNNKANSRGLGQRTLGSLALFAGVFSWSVWFLVQSKVTKHYPVVYSATTAMFLLSSLQSATLAFAIERDLSVWIVRTRLEIFTILFAGVVGSGIGSLTMTWCVLKRGPVFTAAFSPLIQVVVGLIDFSFLREQLYLGSVIGSLLVITGLYVLLWAKNVEKKTTIDVVKPIGDDRDGTVDGSRVAGQGGEPV